MHTMKCFVIFLFIVVAVPACSSSLTDSGIFFDPKGAQKDLEDDRRKLSEARAETESLAGRYSEHLLLEEGLQRELKKIEARSIEFQKNVQSVRADLRNKNQEREKIRVEVEKLVSAGRDIQRARENIGRPPDKNIGQQLQWLQQIL